ncbi:MAG: hypothetical protein AAB686_02015 [Patescibacteria group bacterium]
MKWPKDSRPFEGCRGGDRQVTSYFQRTCAGRATFVPFSGHEVSVIHRAVVVIDRREKEKRAHKE